MSIVRRHLPELLAPAGGPDSLRAAVANGADAVYLGVEKLNARRAARNFTLSTLSEACRIAHVRGVLVYLAANVVVLPEELEEALSMVDTAWEAGVDAVIVQDLGLLRAVHETLPYVRLHASTQMNAHNTATLQTLLSLGVSRVTLAREVSLEEIAGLVNGGGVEVECFVHGALCVCYSGQCLMASLVGRRSANRGLCAQPCRLQYSVVDQSGTVLKSDGAHLLSPKDLAGIAVLPELVQAGVASLKIEGRMKSPEYVALATGVYRAALDRVGADAESYDVRDAERSVLRESYSRGFSEAYLIGERGNDMMSYQRPSDRGVPIGRVSSVRGGQTTVVLDEPLESADTIQFWTSAGHFAQLAGALEYSGASHSSAPAGARVSIRHEQSVSAGDRVFRVANAALEAAARRTYEGGLEPIPLEFVVRVVVGEPLRIEARDHHGRSGFACGAVVEPARTKAVTAEEVAAHVGRLGGTPYSAKSWDVSLSPNAGIAFSALHRARRKAIDSYEGAVLESWANRERTHPRLPVARGRAVRPTRSDPPALVAVVSDLRVAEACLVAGADRVQVPAEILVADDVLPGGVAAVLPRIAHDREVGVTLGLACEGRNVVVGNLGLVRRAVEKGACVEAHWSLNAVNALAVEELNDLGARLVWLSPELSGRQVADIAASASLPVGTALYGRQELMVTEHCVLMSAGDCDRGCDGCGRRRGRMSLLDRKGYRFPFRTDSAGRTHIFNAVPLDLTSALPELLSSGVAALRLDLELEPADSAAGVVRRFRVALDSASAGLSVTHDRDAVNTTTGHFFRGVV